MEYKYKKGDKVRVLNSPTITNTRSSWIGKVLTLMSHDHWGVPAWSVEESDCHYRFRESELGPLGPVVTETVTKTRIVPGTYDGVEVNTTEAGIYARVRLEREVFTADELAAAAAVLTALAEGLRDV